MINWMYFPKTSYADDISLKIIQAFKDEEDNIDSTRFTLHSDDVLKKIKPKMNKIGFEVEMSKKKEDLINVPVMFGMNGKSELAFEADAYLCEYGYVVEIEAGRAVTNYQFLKDFYEACMMYNVSYLCIAVRNVYRKSADFQKVCSFFDAMYSNKRISIPLKGLLVIGY